MVGSVCSVSVYKINDQFNPNVVFLSSVNPKQTTNNKQCRLTQSQLNHFVPVYTYLTIYLKNIPICTVFIE